MAVAFERLQHRLTGEAAQRWRLPRDGPRTSWSSAFCGWPAPTPRPGPAGDAGPPSRKPSPTCGCEPLDADPSTSDPGTTPRVAGLAAVGVEGLCFKRLTEVLPPHHQDVARVQSPRHTRRHRRRRLRTAQYTVIPPARSPGRWWKSAPTSPATVSAASATPYGCCAYATT